MMGTKARVFAPLCNRSLEDLVPADSFYRHLEAKLDLGFVCDLVRATYKECGRPSVDPRVFFKLQIVMFFEGIRSERELVRVAADRLSIRWYPGCDLDEGLPDHSSLTRIRRRYGLAVFRRFFEAIVEQCKEAGLVWGKELYFDATQVKANASLDSIAPRFAVEAHLGELFSDEEAESPLADRENPPIELPVPISEAEREQLGRANEDRHFEDQGVRAYVPLPDFDHRTPFYGASRFTYDPERDEYRCPQDHALRRSHAKYPEGVVVYQAEAATCNACPLKANCTESNQGRQVRRSLYAEHLDRVRAHHETAAYETALARSPRCSVPSGSN